MKSFMYALVFGALLLLTSAVAAGQQHPAQPKTIPDSINLIWKSIEQDFTSLAETMPEDKWSFKPTHGEFKDVRTFGEQARLRDVVPPSKAIPARDVRQQDRGTVPASASVRY